MNDEEKQAEIAKWRRRVVVAGILLSLLCSSLPEEYVTPCRLVTDVCSGKLF